MFLLVISSFIVLCPGVFFVIFICYGYSWCFICYITHNQIRWCYHGHLSNTCRVCKRAYDLASIFSTYSIVFYCPSELSCNELAIFMCSIINVIWCLLTYLTIFAHKGSRLLHDWIYKSCGYILYCKFSSESVLYHMFWGWILLCLKSALLSSLCFYFPSKLFFFFFLTHHVLNFYLIYSMW